MIGIQKRCCLFIDSKRVPKYFLETLFALLLDKIRWNDIDIYWFTLMWNDTFRLISKELRTAKAYSTDCHPKIRSDYSNETDDSKLPINLLLFISHCTDMYICNNERTRSRIFPHSFSLCFFVVGFSVF